jgi:hypothetical protein
MRRSRLVPATLLALAAAGLTALSPATALGPGGWDHVGGGASAALNGRVSAMAPGDGALLVGGAFTDAGGRPSADRAAEWDGDTWRALGSAPLDNGEVRAIAYDDGKTYVGGTFVNAGGNADADHLAVWDGVSWEPPCDSVTPPTFDANVDALQIIGNTLFVGGEFQNAADIATADYLLACDLTTGASSSLFATDGQFSGPIYALAGDSLGTLYAGGAFNNLAEIAGADNVAAYTGGTWHALGATDTAAVTGFVRSLDTEGTDLYVGTDAVNIAGIAQADHVARWSGSVWSALGANTAGTNGWLPASASIYALESQDSLVVAGGAFLDANGKPAADYLAAFDGTTWRPIGSNGSGDGPVPAEVHALRIYSKHLYAGGNFTAAGGDSSAKFLAAYPLVLNDNAISKKPAANYAGNDVYDIAGKNESRKASVRKGRSTRFYVKIQNDGLTSGSFRVSGVGGATGIKARYFLQSTGADITSDVRPGNYFTNLAANDSIVLRMVVKVAKKSAHKTTFRITTGPNGGGELDTVLAVVRTHR